MDDLVGHPDLAVGIGRAGLVGHPHRTLHTPAEPVGLRQPNRDARVGERVAVHAHPSHEACEARIKQDLAQWPVRGPRPVRAPRHAPVYEYPTPSESILSCESLSFCGQSGARGSRRRAGGRQEDSRAVAETHPGLPDVAPRLVQLTPEGPRVEVRLLRLAGCAQKHLLGRGRCERRDARGPARKGCPIALEHPCARRSQARNCCLSPSTTRMPVEAARPPTAGATRGRKISPSFARCLRGREGARSRCARPHLCSRPPRSDPPSTWRSRPACGPPGGPGAAQQTCLPTRAWNGAADGSPRAVSAVLGAPASFSLPSANARPRQRCRCQRARGPPRARRTPLGARLVASVKTSAVASGAKGIMRGVRRTR